MRGLRSTLILGVVFVALFAYVYFVESKRPAPDLEPRPRAFSVEADDIQTLELTDDLEILTSLEKRDGTWHLLEPLQTEADQSEASSIATSLAAVEVQRVVEEEPADLARYGLAEPRFELGFKTGDEADFHRLLIGDKTATGGDLYAKVPDEPRVFLIAGYLESAFIRSTFDLRDKSILKFDRDAADRIEVKVGDQVISFEKGAGTEWNMTDPWPVRADSGSVEGLIGNMNTTQMKEIAAQDVDDPATYGLDQPQATVTIGGGSSRATLLIGGQADELSVYARDVSRPAVFTVDAAFLDEVSKPAADYRRKELFEFRAFNATRFEITREGEALAFEKVTGTGENAEETWRQVVPTTTELDRTKVDDVLSKFSSLRADSFTPTRTRTGLDAPAATVVVQYDDDGSKEERVVFGRSGDSVYAVSGDEPGAGVFPAADFDEALEALDALGP